MKYTTLTADHQKQILEQRLAQYEREHYAYALNEKLLDATSSDPSVKEAIKQAKDAQAILDKAHAQVVKELTDLASA